MTPLCFPPWTATMGASWKWEKRKKLKCIRGWPKLRQTWKGLRKGEKLCEELLINNKSSPTKHPLIYKAIENGIDDEILYPSINKLIQAINKREKHMVLSILRDLVPEWVKSELFN